MAEIAALMLAETVAEGQSARRITSDATADELRRAVRELARAGRVRIRTARVDDTVVVARTDADLWHEDLATMRAKLTPPS